MTSRLLVLIVVAALFTPRRAHAQSDPAWELITEKAAFQPRDSCGEAVFNGRLWIMGGWFDSFSEPPADIWSSRDGVTWQQATAKAPWKHSDLPTTIAFRDKLYTMGGWHNGRLPDASASDEVWESSDGAEWKRVAEHAGWSPRLGAAGVVFKDRMFVLGGVERYYFGDDKSLKNDVWCSDDGATWKRLVENAPWQERAYHAALAFNDKLWVFGGGNYTPGYFALNDVWSSPDGIEWTCVTEHAQWKARIWFSGAVYRDRLWMLGGWSNDPFMNWNDAWHSADGEHWVEFKASGVWPARHEQSAYVHDDALWIVAGHAQPLRSDVWRLKLPVDWRPDE